MTWIGSWLAAFVAISVGCADSREAPIGPPTTIPTLDCDAGQWCWVRGTPVRIVGGATADTVLAVGAEGSLLVWDVDRWSANPIPTGRTIVSAAAYDGEIWASDETGSTWHFGGSRWTEHAAGGYVVEVSVGSDGSAWAYGGASAGGHGEIAQSVLYRWGDGEWIVGVEPVSYCLGGDYLPLAADDVWSAGLVCDGTGGVAGVEVQRHDGSGWRPVGDRIEGQGWFATLSLVDGTVQVSASGVFAWDDGWREVSLPRYPQDLSFDQTALRAGSRWVTMPRSLGCDEVFVLDEAHTWCSGRGQIWWSADGWLPTLADPFTDTLDAERWGRVPESLWAGSDTDDTWGSSPDDVFRLRGSTGSVLEHYDGARWTAETDEAVRDVDGGCGDVWLATENGLYRRVEGRDGSIELSAIALPDGLDATEVSLVRCLERDGLRIVVVDGTVVVHDAATGWQPPIFEPPSGWGVADIAGDSLGDLWMLRHGIVARLSSTVAMHFDGTAWTDVQEWTEAAGDLTRAADGAIWLLHGREIVSLSPAAAPIEADWTPYGAELFVAPDAFWITTPHQARRMLR